MPFSATRARLRPLLHNAGFLGLGAPLFEIRKSAGNGTDLMILTPGLGKSLARTLGKDAAVVLMRGHGDSVVGPTLPNAVFRALHRDQRAPAAGGIDDRRPDQFHDPGRGAHQQRRDAESVGAPLGAVEKEGAGEMSRLGDRPLRKSLRRISGWWCLVVCPLSLIVAGAQAQTYPVKPVRIVVPTSAGGGNDFVARLAGQKLAERLGQQFLVDNRPGAGGVTATLQVAKAAPDGYTLLLGFVGQLAMRPHVENVGYDPRKDFIGVSLLASGYQMLAVHPSLPVRSVKQLIAFAKARPGQLNFASANIYTTGHLTGELFNSITGVSIVPIHYKGSGQAAIGVLAGEVHMIFTAITSVMPHAQTKRLVALATTSPVRSAFAPDVPTFVESGVRGVETANWYALAAPAATPKDVIGRLHGELVKIAAVPDYREQLERQGLELQTSTPEQFSAFLQAEYDKWGKVIKSLWAKAPG